METTTSDFFTQPLSSLSTTYPAAIRIFNKYDLDFCCGGKMSLEEACALRQLSAEDVMDEILSGTNAEIPLLHPESWSTSLLIDFIEQNYHRVVRNSIPMVLDLLEKVCAAHAVQHPELLTIKEEFLLLGQELIDHMKKEELILFPALREREKSTSSSGYAFHAHLQQPIAVMEHEHQLAGDYLKMIRTQTCQYTPPADACPTFILAYQKLAEFDRELIQHIHLENNILFKRA